MAKKTKTAGEAAQDLAANEVEATPTSNTGSPEAAKTESSGEEAEGDGSAGDASEGDGPEGDGSEGDGSEAGGSEGDDPEPDELENLETLEEFTKELQQAFNDKIGDLAAALFEPLFQVLNDQKYRVGGSKAVDVQGPGKLTEDQRDLLIKSNQDRAAEQLKKIREGQAKAAQKN